MSKFFSDPGLYPLYASMVAAGVLVVGYCGRMAFYHPDGRFSPELRKTHLINNQEAGSSYYNHSIRQWASAKQLHCEMMGDWNKSQVEGRLAKK